MKRIVAVLAGTLAVVGLTYTLHPLRPASSGRAAVAPAVLPARGGTDSAPGGGTDLHEIERLIGAYEAQVHDHPNVEALNLLTRLYLRRGKVTGDIATYLQAEAAVGRALKMG